MIEEIKIKDYEDCPLWNSEFAVCNIDGDINSERAIQCPFERF
jgi:hypothetical protein